MTNKDSKKKAIPLTIREEAIIEEIEKVWEEINPVEELRYKISENIRHLFEYYNEEDNAPEEIREAA